MTPHHLSILARAPAPDVKAFVNDILPFIGPVDMLKSQTGIVMLPAKDSAKEVKFHLGEILMAEATVCLRISKVEGYGACLGRDLQHATAIAILDAALRAEVSIEPIQTFIEEQRQQLAQFDAKLARGVESTRVSMETF